MGIRMALALIQTAAGAVATTSRFINAASASWWATTPLRLTSALAREAAPGIQAREHRSSWARVGAVVAAKVANHEEDAEEAGDTDDYTRGSVTSPWPTRRAMPWGHLHHLIFMMWMIIRLGTLLTLLFTQEPLLQPSVLQPAHENERDMPVSSQLPVAPTLEPNTTSPHTSHQPRADIHHSAEYRDGDIPHGRDHGGDDHRDLDHSDEGSVLTVMPEGPVQSVVQVATCSR